MQISISDPQLETFLFTILLLGTVLITIKYRDITKDIFPAEITRQLKGLAILTILFGHIGYFLSKNTEFLFPLSTASGVGVNLFLFLSGFGLTVSQFNRPLGIFDFYRKRLTRLFLPMWIVITILLATYYLFFNLSFPQSLIIKNYFGIFPVADLYLSLNSVLWYFSLIFFYYLIFPFLMRKPIRLAAFIMIYYTSIAALQLDIPIGKDVIDLYKLHIYAFPLGVFFATIPEILKLTPTTRKILDLSADIFKNRSHFFSYLFSFICFSIFGYYAIHSGIGQDKKTEQLISLLTMFSAVAGFMLLPLKSSFFKFLGEYSYEIYLIHWPILYHFDLLYKFTPPFIATYLYLFLFLGLGILLQKAVNFIFKKTSL